MTAPLVTVIVPAYNVGPYVTETLDSALAQTHHPTEIIVVDDGSTDDTPQRLLRYGRAIRSLHRPRGGQAAARNSGLSEASGDFVAFLDADDLWLPNKLEIQLSVAARYPDSGLIVCDGVGFEGGTVVSERLLHGELAARLAAAGGAELSDHLYRELVQHCAITCPAQTLIPRAVVEKVGPLATGDLSDDWDYYLRIARRYPVTLHGHSLVRYRCRPSGEAGPIELRSFRWALRAIPVLQRELRVCALADRPVLRASLQTHARREARRAYYHGRRKDLAFARSYLLRLSRRVPSDPVVLAYCLALRLPDGAAGHLGATARRVARLLGAVRRPGGRLQGLRD